MKLVLRRGDQIHYRLAYSIMFSGKDAELDMEAVLEVGRRAFNTAVENELTKQGIKVGSMRPINKMLWVCSENDCANNDKEY